MAGQASPLMAKPHADTLVLVAPKLSPGVCGLPGRWTLVESRHTYNVQAVPPNRHTSENPASRALIPCSAGVHPRK